MHKKFARVPVYITMVIIIAAMLLAGCSSTGSSSSSTPASTPSSSGQPAQGQQSGQQGEQQGGQKGGPGGQDMQAMQARLLARVAEILGVSSDSLKTAYEAAVKEVMGNKAPSGSGQPPSGGSQGGTPPTPPSDNRTGGPGGQGGPGGGKGGPDMSGVYARVASALGLTTEKVQAAFEQAQKELMPAQPGK